MTDQKAYYEPTRDSLLKLHKELCESAFELMKRKNADYADNDSPFGNLDLIEALSRGAHSTELGIVIRLGDKLSRLMTATRRDLQVKDESIRDTILDIINYAVLYQVKRLSRGVSSSVDNDPLPPTIPIPWPEGTPPVPHKPTYKELLQGWPKNVTGWPKNVTPIGSFDKNDDCEPAE